MKYIVDNGIARPWQMIIFLEILWVEGEEAPWTKNLRSQWFLIMLLNGERWPLRSFVISSYSLAVSIFLDSRSIVIVHRVSVENTHHHTWISRWFLRSSLEGFVSWEEFFFWKEEFRDLGGEESTSSFVRRNYFMISKKKNLLRDF